MVQNLSRLRVSGETARELVLPLVWLRDHCQDPMSYNKMTNQRTSNATHLLEKAELDGEHSVQLKDETSLIVSWKDGLRSVFHIDDIVSRSELDRPPHFVNDVKPWNNLDVGELPLLSMWV